MDFRLLEPATQSPRSALPFHEWVFPDGTRWTQFFRTRGGYLLRFPGLADFTVSGDGRRVLGRPEPGVSDATAHHLYQNQVLPLALSLLGLVAFHASAVDVGAAAAAFVGASGLGKSTLAAFFASRGDRFLCDDGAVLMERDGHTYITPGYPSVRLWEDSRQALCLQNLPPGASFDLSSKARFFADDTIRFCDTPLALRCMYFLDNEPAAGVAIEPVASAEAMLLLVRHSFILDIQHQDLLKTHFERLAALAGERRCFRLRYPRRFEWLDSVRDSILKHSSMQPDPVVA